MKTDHLWLVAVTVTLAVGCGTNAPPDEATSGQLTAKIKAQIQNPDGGGLSAQMAVQTDTSQSITISKTYTDTTTTTGTGTATGTATLTNSQTATGTKTYTATRTLTGTFTGTRTGTLTSSGTRTSSGTATGTATWTGTYRGTGTATGTKTFTATLTGTATLSATFTITATGTQTKTATKTVVGTRTGTGTKTVTQTYTATPRTVTTTLTSTSTRTGTETATNPCYGTWGFCDNFESGSSSQWMVKQGTASDFSVVGDGSKVYKQASATAAVWHISQAGSKWMDQTVEGRLKALSFSSSSAQVLLFGRYETTLAGDCAYTLSLRGDGKVALGKRVNGVNSTLGTPVASGIVAGTWYTLKLDMAGTAIKAYLNDTLKLTQTDATCEVGEAGVGSVGASFEADDVRVTAPTTNSCIAAWTGNACDICTGQTQEDKRQCYRFLNCYAQNACGPESCGGDDELCGVHQAGNPANPDDPKWPKLNAWGTAPKVIADNVYKCMGCPGSVRCDSPAKPNWTSCADGDLCTTYDHCQDGVCVGEAPISCSASDQCHVAGTCDSNTGICSNPNATDDTQCDDGNSCTAGDKCTSGSCAGTPAEDGTVCGRAGCVTSVCYQESCGPDLQFPAHSTCISGQVPSGTNQLEGGGITHDNTPGAGNVSLLADGAYLAYFNYQFNDVNRFAAHLATRRSDDHIEVHLDSIAGALVADLETLPTLSNDPSKDPFLTDPASYQREDTAMLTTVTGVHDVYLVLRQGTEQVSSSPLLRLNYWEFYKGPVAVDQQVPYPHSIIDTPLLTGDTVLPAMATEALPTGGVSDEVPEGVVFLGGNSTILLQPNESADARLDTDLSVAVAAYVTWTGGRGPVTLQVLDQQGNVLGTGTANPWRLGGTVSAYGQLASFNTLFFHMVNTGSSAVQAEMLYALWMPSLVGQL